MSVNSKMTAIADAIRSRSGGTGKLTLDEMAVAIQGLGRSQIIVTAPTGSTVTATMGGITKTAVEKNGVWTFKNCDLGTWTITATKDGNSALQKIVISEEGQLMRYYASIFYWLSPADFDLAAYGAKGVDYEVEQDDETVIPIGDYGKHKNWRIKLLTSNEAGLMVRKTGAIDVFCVGGGSGGGRNDGNTFGNGGCGGYTATEFAVDVGAGESYSIVIGSGGASNSSGGNTTAFGVSALGGTFAKGGSGGGASGEFAGTGGSDGKNGNTASGVLVKSPGLGQGTTTREFGEPTGKLYAGGGGGGSQSDFTAGGDGGGGFGGSISAADATQGKDSTGGGGGGSGKSGSGARGGSGIVVIRNAREVA